ncbi:hypothetical protein PUN28_013649 [Cardiocondyla obscurior]|uniref:Uncharacterized protein n=1 Tax=Cardiocondyla obscurior TaxID=286306 RepID=A0AAW2F3Z9_9HYME
MVVGHKAGTYYSCDSCVARIIGGPDGTMKLIYHAFLLGLEVLRAPVYIRKRNADPYRLPAGFYAP